MKEVPEPSLNCYNNCAKIISTYRKNDMTSLIISALIEGLILPVVCVIYSGVLLEHCLYILLHAVFAFLQSATSGGLILLQSFMLLMLCCSLLIAVFYSACNRTLATCIMRSFIVY